MALTFYSPTVLILKIQLQENALFLGYICLNFLNLNILKNYLCNDSFLEIQPLPQQRNYAISNAQKRLWVLSQFEESSRAYNLPNTVELKGDYEKNYVCIRF